LSPCNGYCKNCCDFSKYQLSATDKIEHAVYDSYTCNGTGVTKYKFLKCEDGYEGNARGCIKIDPCINVEDKNCDVCKTHYDDPCANKCKECCNFGEYTLSESDKIANAEYDSMTCGGVTKYKFLKCEDGYEGDARECSMIDPCATLEDKSCDICKTHYDDPCANKCKECCNFGEYTLSASDKIAHAEYDSMTCGGVTKYKFLKCEDGYENKGGICLACEWGDYTATSCGNYCLCGSCWISKTCGGMTRYNIIGCGDGKIWDQETKRCITNCEYQCAGYNDSASIVSNPHNTVDICVCNDTDYYKLVGCAHGYAFNASKTNCIKSSLSNIGLNPTKNNFDKLWLIEAKSKRQQV